MQYNGTPYTLYIIGRLSRIVNNLFILLSHSVHTEFIFLLYHVDTETNGGHKDGTLHYGKAVQRGGGDPQLYLRLCLETQGLHRDYSRRHG